jgi:DNA-binding NtrC family response regulator
MAFTSTNEASAPSVVSISVPAQPSLAFLPQELAENTSTFHGLTGRSPSMRQLIQQMQRIAPHLSLATLEGEEGTGKTLAARALHAAGPAAQEGQFVPCLAAHFFSAPERREEAASPMSPHPIPEAGWSSEALRRAHRGMLFLDRIHQLSAIQQRLLVEFLHWFDDREFHASKQIGEDCGPQQSLPSQIVLTSSVPLRHLQASAAFRKDLVSRLCAVRFRLPPLIERREDIPLLAQIFIQRFARTYGKSVRGLGPGTVAPLLRYSWPGNVTELENVISAAALETESQWIRPIDLPPLPAGGAHRHWNGTGHGAHPLDPELNLDCAIRNHVGRVLERTRGNKLRAAQLLGISRSTLYRILAAKEPLPI